MQNARRRKRAAESALSTTVSEDIGSIRICGIGTFNGTDAANVTIVVIIGARPGTANGKSLMLFLLVRPYWLLNKTVKGFN